MRRVRLASYLIRYFGLGWLVYRARYAAERRLGRHARRERFLASAPSRVSSALVDAGFSTAEKYAAYRREAAPAFFFGPGARAAYGSLFSRWDANAAGAAPAESVERIKSGTFRYFEHTDVEVGFPPDWHRNPFTGVTAPSDRHWSRIEERSLGDIKVIWELSRFAFVYPLVRHYWRTGDGEVADLFWQLVEDWDRANPTCQGVNWRCSQEIGIRVMAWCVGLYGFIDAAASTPERIERLSRMMWASGHRIQLDLPDACSQQNNHAITAAAGMLTIGLLFPEFQESAGWIAEGRRTLERLAQELIYSDGSFVQHSLNYHRLMLHDYVWALRLGQLAGVEFSSETWDRVRRSTRLLWQLQDETSGRVPHYGHSDGALILPLDNCGYLDFRPVTQAAGYLIDGTRWWPAGPWDEDLLWLFGTSALDAPAGGGGRSSVAAVEGGYFTLRGTDTFLMTRCATFRHRPAQADMLHVDVWWRGENVAVDAGTFSYGEGGTLAQELVRTRAHNTVGVDGADQMDRLGRFMWFPWLTSRERHECRTSPDDIDYWEGEHDGYARRGVRHRRGIVRLPSSAWLVIDRLEARRPHAYRLHWLLPDVVHEWDERRLSLRLRFEAGDYGIQVLASEGPVVGTVTRAAADGAGWRSEYYNCATPALALSVRVDAVSLTFATLMAPSPATMRMDQRGIEVAVEGQVHRVAADGSMIQGRP